MCRATASLATKEMSFMELQATAALGTGEHVDGKDLFQQVGPRDAVGPGGNRFRLGLRLGGAPA
jgi:hypothetical protein